MTMNCATQQTASSHREPGVRALSGGGASGALGVAAVSTLIAAKWAAQGATGAW